MRNNFIEHFNSILYEGYFCFKALNIAQLSVA